MNAIEQWLAETIGLDPGSMGGDVISRAAKERMRARGCPSPQDYVAVLRAEPDERRELIERVVVSETWFFRDRAALDEMARYVVSIWNQAHARETFRVLSLPCATGEEPYSIAMALAQSGWPLARLHVDAVDISNPALARAATGIYGRNSFRGDDLRFRDVFFSAIGPAQWRILPELQRVVHLASGNLLAPEFGVGLERYHAICCRNLLIYFDAKSRARATRTLASLLAEDGWLVLGPAEATEVMDRGFEPVSRAVSSVLRPRRPAPGGARSVPRPPQPTSSRIPARWRTRQPEPAESAAVGRAHTARTERGAGVPTEPTGPELAAVQTLADAGRVQAAANAAEALLARRIANSELLYLAAVTQDANGQVARAEELYRKLLYLEPRHTDALLHLALLAERRGNPGEAARLRARARRSTDAESA